MTSAADILRRKALAVDDQKAIVLRLGALQAGARDFIRKQFDPDEVLARYRSLTEARLKHIAAMNFIKSLEQMIREVETSREQERIHGDAGGGTGIHSKSHAGKAMMDCHSHVEFI